MTKAKPIESAEKFVVVLERSQLFAPNQLEAIKKLAETAEAPLSIARTLVKKGWLTKWQASQLLSGFSNLTLGKYRLADHLGKGELGNVYLAENPKLGRKVALKTLSTKHTESPELVKRFLDEARAAAALDHRNIIHIHDVSSENQRHYVVMEYVNGRDLQSRVNAEGQLSFTEAASVIRQAAEGLRHAHEQGVVHRDIKPANIMVDDQGIVKILDIGVGHLRRSESNPSENTGELMMSATAYMAPEHARGKAVDARCDVYSLGGVLYFLLTARAPFATKTDAERSKIKESKRPIPIAALRADAPKTLVDLCERMMALKPDDRFASMAEVLAALASADELVAGTASNSEDATLVELVEVEAAEAFGAVDLEVEVIDDVVAVTKSKPQSQPNVKLELEVEPEPEGATPAIKIDLGGLAKPVSAIGPMDFAINTKKRKKGSVAKPVPAAKAAPEKPVAAKTSQAVATVGDAPADGDHPQPASAVPKKGLSKGLIIGGVCAAGLLLITGVGVGVLMLLGGGDEEVAQATAGTTGSTDDAASEGTTGDEATDATPGADAVAANASAESAKSDDTPAAVTEAAADPFGNVAAAAPSASAVEPAEGAGGVAATEPAAAAAPTDAPPPPAKTEPTPDSPAPETPAADKPEEVKPVEVNPEPAKTPEPATVPVPNAPPKAKTFAFAPAVDLPIPAADAPELTLGQINVRPEDAIFISLDGGDIAAAGRSEFSVQNAQDGVAPRDWEFVISDGGADPVVIATMSMPESDLKFKWTAAGVENPNSTNLRNCSLKITAGQDQPQDLALRTPQKVAPVTVDVEKSATVKLPLEGAPDRSSLKLEVTVKGHKSTVDPPQIELGKGGGGIVYFGESQEQAAFALKLDASINARGIQVKTEPHFLVPVEKSPVRLNKASIKKYESLRVQQESLQSKIFEGEKAVNDANVAAPQKAQFQGLLVDLKQQLELVSKTVEKMTQLNTDMPAIGSGASLQFRVYSDTFEKQIDLIVPDPDAAPVAP